MAGTRKLTGQAISTEYLNFYYQLYDRTVTVTSAETVGLTEAQALELTVTAPDEYGTWALTGRTPTGEVFWSVTEEATLNGAWTAV